MTSSVGYGLVYNTVDNNKNPTSGINFNFGQDFAGVGGDEAYMRSVVDFHSYYETGLRPHRHPAFASRQHHRLPEVPDAGHLRV